MAEERGGEVEPAPRAAHALVDDRRGGRLAAILNRDASTAVGALPVGAVQVSVECNDVVASGVESLARRLADGNVWNVGLAFCSS